MNTEDGKETTESAFDFEKIAESTARKKALKKPTEMPYKEFLKLAENKDGSVSIMSAKAFAWNTIRDGGIEDVPEEEKWKGATKRYTRFSKKLFGIDNAIQRVALFFKAGMKNKVVGRKILVLLGPVSSGKTTLIMELWRAMEENRAYNRYQIKGCPLHETPLHLTPRCARRETWNAKEAFELSFKEPIEDTLRIRSITGDLCHKCRVSMLETYQGKWWEVPVEPLLLSVRGQVGFGSFKPVHIRHSDQSTLIGGPVMAVRENLKRGKEDPDAWDWKAALWKSGGGSLHCIEVFTADTDSSLLKLLSDVASDGWADIPGSGFPKTYIDTVIIGDINFTGFKAFEAKMGEEAFRNRVHVEIVPYPLDWHDNLKVLNKLLNEGGREFEDFEKIHMDPAVLPLIAKFTALTTYVPSKKVTSFIKKLQIYGGENLLLGDKIVLPEELYYEGQNFDDVAKMEGCFGIGARDLLDAVGTRIESLLQDGKKCMTASNAIDALKDYIEHHHQMGVTPEEKKRQLAFLTAGNTDGIEAIRKKFVIERVERAFLKTYGGLSRTLRKKYVDNCVLYTYLNSPTLAGLKGIAMQKDTSGKPKEVDEKFLQEVEEHWTVPIQKESRRVHRGDINSLSTRPDCLEYHSLVAACDATLLHQMRPVLRTVLSSSKEESADPKAQGEDVVRKADEFLKVLESDDEECGGYCEHCAQVTVEDGLKYLDD
ncbi:hypothetical protein L0Y69_03565 [bacterium]|nr:hypothetical protein [bacterium]